MANKTNLGKVIGDSAFEDWLKKNPGKAWEDFMEAIKGPGILGFRYKETASSGGLIYDVILDGNIVSGTIEIPPGATGADFLTLEFIRFDAEGNTVVKSKNSKGEYGDEILIKRGLRGFTGGTVVGDSQPSIGFLYGEKKEFVGEDAPSGWAYANGGIISKYRYPQMTTLLKAITYPRPSYFVFKTNFNGGWSETTIDNMRGVTFRSGNVAGRYYQQTQDYFRARVEFKNILGHVGGFIYDYGQDAYGMGSGYYYIDLSEKLALTNIKINTKNVEGNSFYIGNYDYTKNVDWHIVIEYLDENNNWQKGTEIYNKTDFLPFDTEKSIHVLKNSFKSNRFRMYVDESKSTPNVIYDKTKVFFIGDLEIEFDKNYAQYSEFLSLPIERDNQEKYKIIYIGEPLEITEPTMYSYSKDNIFNGEVPLSLAVNNKLPNYVEGITMTEPIEPRIGYLNKYNKETDIWELVKTHEKKEGYYYDVSGDLKYIVKPTNYHIWDFKINAWVEDVFLKENIKKELLDKYIELEIKKDKMIELGLNVTYIDQEIQKIKKELEGLNG